MPAIRKQLEGHFSDAEQVRGYLTDALQVVDEVGVPDDLRAAAFTKAVELLAQKQVTFEVVSGAGVILDGVPAG